MKVKAKIDISCLDDTTMKETETSPSIKSGDIGYLDVVIINGKLALGFKETDKHPWYLLPYELKEWFDEIP